MLSFSNGGREGEVGFPDLVVEPVLWVLVAGESCPIGFFFFFSVLLPIICLLAGEAQVLPSVCEHQNSPGR